MQRRWKGWSKYGATRKKSFHVKQASWSQPVDIRGVWITVTISDWLQNELAPGLESEVFVLHPPINLSARLPLSTAALCCLLSWLLCKCVVTLLPARKRNHWLMFKFPWLTVRMYFSALHGWKRGRLDGDAWADVRLGLTRERPKLIRQTKTASWCVW